MIQQVLLSILFWGSFRAIAGGGCSTMRGDVVIPGAPSEFTPLIPQNERQQNDTAAATATTERAADYQPEPVYGIFAYHGQLFVGYHLNNIPEGHGALINTATNTVWIGNFFQGTQVPDELRHSRTINLLDHNLRSGQRMGFRDSDFGLVYSGFIDIGIFQDRLLLHGHGIRIAVLGERVLIMNDHFSRGQLAGTQNEQAPL